jgi:putative transposase
VPRFLSPEQHALWRERLSSQANSGLTVAQFCARERLSVTTFQVWKRRLRVSDLADHHPASAPPPAFVPVKVRAPEYVLSEPLMIEADLPNGVRLRIPTANALLACRIVRAVARVETRSGGSK